MRALCLVFSPVLLLMGMGLASAQDKEDARKLVSGRWTFVVMKIEKEVFQNSGELVFDGESFTWEAGGTVVEQGKVKWDFTKTPPWIDLVFSEKSRKKPLSGVFEVTKDDLRICFKPFDQERPVSVKPDPKSTPIVWILTRRTESADRTLAKAYLERAEAFAEKKSFDSAIADSTEAIRLDPRLANAYHQRGEAYFGKESYDSAIPDYTEALWLDPRLTTAYLKRGVAYYWKEDYDKAIADLSEFIRGRPDFAPAYTFRGFAYRDKGDTANADLDFAKAESLKKK